MSPLRHGTYPPQVFHSDVYGDWSEMFSGPVRSTPEAKYRLHILLSKAVLVFDASCPVFLTLWHQQKTRTLGEVKQLPGPKRNRSWADGLLELEGLCAVLILHVTHYSRGLTEMHAIRVRLVLIVPGWLLPYPQILQLTRPGTQPL